MKSALKPLVRSLLLVLGLSPVATLSADELSQTSSTRKGAGQPAAASVFTGTVVQNIHYAPQLNLGGFYGTGGNSYAEADVWLPLWQTSDQVAYADVRYQKEENTQWDIALGGGYRWLSEDMARLYDVYGFYNSYNSSYNNQFQQIMVGGSVRNEDWTLRGNYYYSIGPTRYTESSLDSLSFQSFGGISSIQNYGLLSYGFEENSINGGVIEIGRTVPAVAGLSLFGGYYGFASTSVNPFMNGFRARAEYVLDEAFNFSTPFLRHVTLESMVQYDNVNKGVFTIGARFDIPLGKSSTNSKLQAAMMDYVHFYPHAVQEEVTFTTPVIYQQNGQAVIFDIVNTPGQFIDAMDDGSNVVIINNNLQFGGLQNLGSNKYITGQNYEYSPGKFINVTGKDTLPTLTAPENSNLFILGQNNTLRDMNLVVTPQATGATGLNYIITNNALTDGVGTLNVDHVSGTGGIFIQVADGSADSNISITNNTLNMTSVTSAVGVYNAAIQLTVNNASSMTVEEVSANNITFTQPSTLKGIGIKLTVNNSTGSQIINNINDNQITFTNTTVGTSGQIQGIYLPNAGTQTVTGSIDGNTVNLGSNSSGALGIFFSNSSNQTINLVTNNTVNFEGAATNSIGIYSNNSGTGTQTIGSADNNALTFGDGATSSQGIYFYNAGTQTIGSADSNTLIFGDSANLITSIFVQNFLAQTINSINDNTIIFNGVATASNGVYFSSNLSTIMSIGDIKNNMITFTGAVINSNGIFLNFNAKNNIALTVGSIDSNTINFKGGADTPSAGVKIYLYDFATTLSIDGINNNTISFGSNSTGASAIIVNNHISGGVGEDSLTVNGMYGNNIITESGNGIYLATYISGDLLVINIAQPGVTNTNDVAGLSAANHGSFINTQNVFNDTLTINGGA